MQSLEKLKKISSNKSIILYQNFNIKNTYKGMGRIIGDFNNKELLEILKYTNGASILGYCFLGIKNNKLGTNLDSFQYELWQSNDLIAGKMIGFMIDELGGTFGFLINDKVKYPLSPIVYYSQTNPNKLFIIGSSFDSFFFNFLNDIEYTIETNTDGLLIDIEIENWPFNSSHWLKNDQNLPLIYNALGTENGIIELI
ncbi:hypothetical protein [Aquimarina agarivorans]|uniref:hypothetical protein n=1 Tax=Aquimarina agarivorans TaxID=980584 RepID=UPI000248FB29|nr:hypothetical protein [Aquimarina agarivorans]